MQFIALQYAGPLRSTPNPYCIQRCPMPMGGDRRRAGRVVGGGEGYVSDRQPWYASWTHREVASENVLLHTTRSCDPVVLANLASGIYACTAVHQDGSFAFCLFAGGGTGDSAGDRVQPRLYDWTQFRFHPGDGGEAGAVSVPRLAVWDGWETGVADGAGRGGTL